MKRLLVIFSVLCLAGCSKPSYETVADVPVAEVSAPCRQIMVNIPEESAVLAGTDDTSGRIYDCGEFTMSVQTLPSGDLDETIFALTGYHREELQLIESVKNTEKRYDCVFTSAGEDGLNVGRVCILDDGNYHYAVSVLAPETSAGDCAGQWQDIYTSFQIADEGWDINTGS